MSSSKLHTLYKQLIRAFTSQPSDLKASGRLLAELKVRSVCYTLGLTDASFYQVVLIETGLIFPQTDYSTQDLVITREYFISRSAHRQKRCLINYNTGEILEIGAYWSIRTKEAPSFDRYFSQLQTFYNDYR